MKPRISIGAIHFSLEAERDERGALGGLPIVIDEHNDCSSPLPAEQGLPPSRLLRVWGRARVETSCSAQQLRVLEAQTHARCPVANMMQAAGVELRLKFEFASSSESE